MSPATSNPALLPGSFDTGIHVRGLRVHTTHLTSYGSGGMPASVAEDGSHLRFEFGHIGEDGRPTGVRVGMRAGEYRTVPGRAEGAKGFDLTEAEAEFLRVNWSLLHSALKLSRRHREEVEADRRRQARYAAIHAAAPAVAPGCECLECGAVYDEPGHVRSHGMGCDRCDGPTRSEIGVRSRHDDLVELD